MSLYGQIHSFEDIPKDILKHLNEIGLETSPSLDSRESRYFNVVFKELRGDFDFTEKKVGFITGSNGNKISNKREYFDKERDRHSRNYSPNKSILYVFNENQKEKSGGYDAVIVYWSKVLLLVDDLPQKLKRQNGKTTR